MILSKIGDEVILPGAISVKADPAVVAQMDKAIESAVSLKVETEQDLPVVTNKAKELKGFLNQVENGRKMAKQNFLDGGRAVDSVANGIKAKLETAYKRLTQALAVWNDRQEAIAREEERKRREADQAEIERRRREAEAAEALRKELIAKQQAAVTIEDLEDATLERELFESDLSTDALANELGDLELALPPEPKLAPIPGMRTVKRYNFKLTDPLAAYKFSKALVRFEIDKQSANDIVKDLLAQGLPLQIPGVEITPYTSVESFTGTARIE